MAYQPNIPTGSVPLNQDYLNIQGNFSSLNTSFGRDHQPLTTATFPPDGYHTWVHLVPFSTTASNPPNNQPVTAPAATAGYGQLFGAQINDGINTDQALYYLSGGNRLTQLTRNIQPLATATGYTFLPGGLIMQWGTATSGAGVTFNVAAKFTTLFSIQITPFSAGGAQTITSAPQTFNVLSTGFTVGNNSGNLFNYYWMAFGI